MRLDITVSKESHAEACTSVAVSLTGGIISGGDDFALRRWDASGESLGVVRQFDSCVTCIAWAPPAPGARRSRVTTAGSSDGADNCLVGCADGTITFMNVSSGRVERVVEAHSGGVTGMVYAADGSALVTAGEDGCVKVWSQAGIFRSTLASTGSCVYALCWGSEAAEWGGDCILYTIGGEVILKPLNPSVKKQFKWRAHRGVVLCASWSRMSGFIVTGGEDGTYKVWDLYGRNLYTSAAGEHPVTAVQFSADGEMFAVGSFMNVRVCSKTGWSHTYERLTEGSALDLQWTPDGTQLVMGGGTGAVCVAQIVGRVVTWGSYSATLVDGRKLLVQDVVKDSSVDLEQRDKVIKLEMGYGHLVVCSTTTCACYPLDRVNAPVVFDLQDAVITLLLGTSLFLIADCNQGIQLYSYEGRQICTLRTQVSLRPEMLAAGLIALSADTVALRHPADHRRIAFYDANSGRQVDEATVNHTTDVLSVHLSQAGDLTDRKLAFVDRNNDLYFGAVHRALGMHKLSTMTTSVAWHDSHETLVAITDGHLTAWYYPSLLLFDRDLLPLTKQTRDDAGEDFAQNDRITACYESRVQVRRGSDGALLTFSLSPYPALLFRMVAARDWDGATRLGRFLDDKLLWAILTGVALRQGELNVAEVGYGALSELDKVRYIRWLKTIPTPEGRQAELALFQHRPAEAERILLQSGLVYRCIDMHARLFNWERALKIAVERKTHVDTVLARRQRFLAAANKKETLEDFKELEASVTVDWNVIKEKVKHEMISERERPNAKPYQ